MQMFSKRNVVAAALLAMAYAACSPGDPTANAGSSTPSQTTMIPVRFLDEKGRPGPLTPTPRVVKTDAEWKKQLTTNEYAIARGKGTEPAFCGAFFDNHKPGVYECVCCGLPLFTSETKFDSGTGWPSFFQPFAKENVVTHPDNSLGMQRTEVLCALCGAHLGHVFQDGPRPTGLRFCMNSASLVFKENKNLKDATTK